MQHQNSHHSESTANDQTIVVEMIVSQLFSGQTHVQEIFVIAVDLVLGLVSVLKAQPRNTLIKTL